MSLIVVRCPLLGVKRTSLSAKTRKMLPTQARGDGHVGKILGLRIPYFRSVTPIALRNVHLAVTMVSSETLGGHLRRREFITLLGSAATSLPHRAWAQQQIPLVGFLNSASPDTYRFNADSFREGLTKAGLSKAETSVLRNDGREATTRPCRLSPLNLWPKVWLPLPPPEMLLLHARRSVRAARCLWSLRSAATPSALDWSIV